ncbi:MAG: 4-hydroxy-3-methylbut-2-enyl diphosphate reductase [Lentisphaeria bacterium]|nr:4-hydroxy-3-methylbut-2-enyl diphosphate reductase [Lentisphaeria bacterium]
MPLKRILLAEPAGFCAGVKRAVDMLDQALQDLDTPIYCYRELVHNRQVIEQFTARGVRFVENLSEVPVAAVLVFSAHGVSPALLAEASQRQLRVIDATCPFVARIHSKVRQFVAEGHLVFLVGHRGHDEVRGVIGEAPGSVLVIENPDEAEDIQVPQGIPVALVTQTTLSISDTEKTVSVLCRRFPKLATLPQSDICSAVRSRQIAVRRLASLVKHVLVLGAQNSSNSLRLVEVAREAGANATLISSLDDLQKLPWQDMDAVGITAGASTPDSFIQAVIEEIKRPDGAVIFSVGVSCIDSETQRTSVTSGNTNECLHK